MSAPVEHAVVTLAQRAARMHRRANRARIGSNERRKCTQRAMFMAAAAQKLDADKSLQKELERQGVLAKGWRGLGQAIADETRKREQKP